jgi:alpha,alpha-trehalase
MKNLLHRLFFLLALTAACRPQNQPETPLEDKQHLSPDERYGELFVDVQMNQVFADGKTFVDCVPRFPTDVILEKYEANKEEADFDLEAFVEENFDLPKQYASGFHSDTARSAIEHINALWPVLTRQPDADDAGTLIPLPHPYIVPGGRFGEIYYWDSYFTMLGLQVAGKVDMIENMVDNFAYLIDTVGFIPNGNRTYFLTRSQPPFFPLMVTLLAGEKGEETYIRYLPQLRKEYDYWMDGLTEVRQDNPVVKKLVRLQDGSLLNRYWDRGEKPRPEMYRDDVMAARAAERPKPEVYKDLRSAAESGWDFSSRWLTDPMALSTIHTTDIIPVDLNALLYNMERTLERAYRLDGNDEQADLFAQRAGQRRTALLHYCWDEERAYFMDYDFVRQQKTLTISVAGVYPLFFRMVEEEYRAQGVAAMVRAELLKPGGVVTTTNLTGQQWDAPNGWAPLEWIAIQGLRNYGFEELAEEIKSRWVDLNLRVYQNTGKMVEKYNVMDMNLEAGGGEYPVQDGFGWTNGVLLRLLTENPPDR